MNNLQGNWSQKMVSLEQEKAFFLKIQKNFFIKKKKDQSFYSLLSQWLSPYIPALLNELREQIPLF